MMFVVEAYVELKETWDKEQHKLIAVKPYLYNPCGTDYCIIIHDLKTLRGVRNRLAKVRWAEEVVEVRIYAVSNIFNRETYSLQYIKPLKGNKTSIRKIAEERKDWGKAKCQFSI